MSFLQSTQGDPVRWPVYILVFAGLSAAWLLFARMPVKATPVASIKAEVIVAPLIASNARAPAAIEEPMDDASRIQPSVAVVPVEQPPLTIKAGQASEPIAIKVPGGSGDKVSVAAVSGNTKVVSNSGLQLMGEGKERQLVITPEKNAEGVVRISIVTFDGKQTHNDSFQVEVVSAKRAKATEDKKAARGAVARLTGGTEGLTHHANGTIIERA